MEMNKKEFPILLKKEMDIEMVGQNEGKKAIAIAVYRHIFMNIKCPILLYGPTGAGKTMLFQLLRKSRLLPKGYTVMISNVSRLTEEGYKGQNIGDVLKEYARICREQGNTEKKGIIYLDEFDKLTNPDVSTNDKGETYDHNEALLFQMMQLLDGEIIEGISTDNILFVFGGVFDKLSKSDNNKLTNRIGFTPIVNSSCRIIESDNYSIRQRMQDIGVPREFLGRIGEIVKIDKLTRNELKAILLHPTRGVIARFSQEYALNDISLEVTCDVVDELVDCIVGENLGARSVKNVMECLLEGAMYHCFENGYDKIILDKDSLLIGHPKYKKCESDFESKAS